MQPVKDLTIEEILSAIKDYQTRSVSSPSGLTPIEIIIHAKDNLASFATTFQALCNDLTKNAPPLPNFSWELGMFPFATKCEDAKYRMGMFFIPILCKEGYQSINPGDPNYPDYVMDFMDANVRDTYYKTNLIYVYDFGNLYP